MSRVRLRGIYTTALTRQLLDASHEVVQASPAIEERFDTDLPAVPYDVALTDTGARQGVRIDGDPVSVADVAATLRSVARDALAWTDPAPRSAVFDGVVTEVLGSGAVVSLADASAAFPDDTLEFPLPASSAEGFLPYDEADGYVDEGDHVRVQVHEPAAPWDDDRPLLSERIELTRGILSLVRGRSETTAAVGGERGTELVRTTEMLPADPPDGWGLRWERPAADADIGTLGDALERASERADSFSLPSDPTDEPPACLAAPTATVWVWFGRESRFAFDESRRDVTTTMPGHHRIKAGDRTASDAVDFVEAICSPTGEFPFGSVTDQFGPVKGDRIALGHGKPDGRLITLGRGEVTECGADGTVTLRREMRSSGTYDAIGTQRQPGDIAITKLKEGRWWYPTVYRGADGERKGTYVNICTPVEVFPSVARYVDLYVDVIKRPDGTVERVDAAELEEAVADGYVPEPLAERARRVASAVENAL